MKVLLTSHGSTGDIYPVVRLGRALLEAGHTVNFASAPLYKETIEKAGMGFLHLPPDWEQEIFTECMRELDQQPNPVFLLRQIYRSGLPFMGQLIDEMIERMKGHDVAVGSYVFPHMRILAERLGIPFGVVTFCHSVVPTPDFPPDTVPNLKFLPPVMHRAFNRVSWNAANFLVDKVVNGVIRDVLAEKGLPPMRNFINGPAELCLVGVSKELMQRSDRIDPRFNFTGYLRWQSAESEEMEKQLNEFCQGEEVPVLTFGSVSFDHIHEVMSRFERHWPRGKKIIIQSGWAGLSVEIGRPEILVIGKLSHDQLFRHASAVIHHGGAGTTGSVLHAGRPHVLVPHFGDQMFWAKEIKRLKAGIIIPQSKWPELLPGAIERLEKRPVYRQRTERLAETLAKEDGPGNAVRAIEEFVRTWKNPLAADEIVEGEPAPVPA